MKANEEGKKYFSKEIEKMLKKLSYEQMRLLYHFIKAMIE